MGEDTHGKKDIKKELDELRKKNEELEKMIKFVFKKLSNVSTNENEEEQEDNKSKQKVQEANNNANVREKKKEEVIIKIDHGPNRENKDRPFHPDPLHYSTIRPAPPHHRREVNRRGMHFISAHDVEHAKEELERARKKLEEAKERIKAERERVRHEARKRSVENAKKYKGVAYAFSKDFDVNGFSETVTKYVEQVLSSLSKNLEIAVKGAFSTPGKKAIKITTEENNNKSRKFYPYDYRNFTIEELEQYLKDIAFELSAIGDENRLHILKILEIQPEYQKSLSEKTGLRGGTFKHHTDILTKAGLITQETVRGRYLITQLGVEALKLAEVLYLRKMELMDEIEDIQKGEERDSNISDSDDSDDSDDGIDIEIEGW